MVGGPETILLYILLIVFAAKVAGEISSRLKQPAVAGEILIGVALGPSLLGIIPPFDILDRAAEGFAAFTRSEFHQAQDLHVLAVLAELGVLILLFEVGLESNLAEFRRVGLSAGLVGFLGVALSLVAGGAASYLIATRMDWITTDAALAAPNLLHAFIGATLTATSVGITARVLGDIGKIRTREAQIILGAAVFDDVLGLIVLAIISGLVVDPSGLTALGVGKVLLFSLGFFFAAIILGVLLAPRIIDVAHRTFANDKFIHLGFAFVVMLLVSYLATLVGLASIVGAFAAGLALSVSPHRHVIFEHLKPVGSIFVSFFFVVLGTRVDLTQLTGPILPMALGIALVLFVVGVIAKLGAGIGVVGTKASRYIVGVGMVPRGEVGLIFALFGLENGLIENWQYATIILVVLATTLVTPFWLKSSASRFIGELEPAPPEAARQREIN